MKPAKWDPYHEVDEFLEKYSKPVDWPFRGGKNLTSRKLIAGVRAIGCAGLM